MSFSAGDEVLAPWADDGYMYPAIIAEVHDSRVHVAYLDGDEGDVDTSSLLRGFELSVGQTVSVNWKGGGEYFDGIVRRRAGNAFFFDYEDGDKGWASIAQVRISSKDIVTAL